MPLSKVKQAEYQKDRRARIKAEEQQPKYIIYEGKRVEIPELDMDGHVIWE